MDHAATSSLTDVGVAALRDAGRGASSSARRPTSSTTSSAAGCNRRARVDPRDRRRLRTASEDDEALKLATQVVKPKGMRHSGHLFAAVQDLRGDPRHPEHGDRTPCSGCGRLVASATAPPSPPRPVRPPLPRRHARTSGATRPPKRSARSLRRQRDPPSSGRSCTARSVRARPQDWRPASTRSSTTTSSSSVRSARRSFGKVAAASAVGIPSPVWVPAVLAAPARMLGAERSAPPPASELNAMNSAAAIGAAATDLVYRARAEVVGRGDQAARREDRGRSGTRSVFPLT